LAYQLNEIFYSIQGEGHRKGTANVFVRFAGCNLRCNIDEHGFDCDTDFSRKFSLETPEDVLQYARRESGNRGKSVIFTGGEPGLQLDEPLVHRFQKADWYVAVETNGMYVLPSLIDWVSCSPKRGITAEELKVHKVHELRLVVDADPCFYMPAWLFDAEYLFLSPAHDNGTNEPNPEALTNAIQLCKEFPEWRLSVQDHKAWEIR